MTEVSAVEIAKKQRYLHLLQKVKENKTLSKVELDELSRYERKMTGKVILNSKIATSTKRSMRPSAKRSMDTSTRRSNKKSKKSKKKILRLRLPVDEAAIRRLGLECDNLAEADAAIKKRKSLKEIFKKHPRLQQAWDRGRFLRNLKAMARTGINVSEAAKKLGLGNGLALRSMLDEDAEVRDIWEQTRLEVYCEIKEALVDEAKGGNPVAIRAVENFLQEEKERPGFEPSRVTMGQLAEITGKNRKTIHDWFTKEGLPRNADKTFDLGIFLAWFEDYTLQKVRVPGGREPPIFTDPLRQMRAEKLKVELAKHRDQLLDRDEVIMGQIAWVQNIVSFCERGIGELSRLCSSQPREKIAEIARVFFQDLHIAAAKVPKELNLPAVKEKELIDFLLGLRSPGEKNDDIG